LSKNWRLSKLFHKLGHLNQQPLLASKVNDPRAVPAVDAQNAVTLADVLKLALAIGVGAAILIT